METLPYELVFSIAVRLDSPRDLCSFSRVSTVFSSVARDDRLWQRLCYRLYDIRPPLPAVSTSFYDLFTKILVPYGRYLGYWKSHEEYVGGLICVRLNGSDGAIIGEKIDAVNESVNANQLFFGEEEDNEDDASLKPVYIRTKLFTIDSLARQIRFDDDDAPDRALPWRKTFASDQQYFGLSQEALPANERSSVISYEPGPLEDADRRDIYFTKACSNGQMIVYRPLAIPEPSTDHPLARFNGIWVGSYGGHGLELLHLEVSDRFNGPTIVDGEATEGVPMALVATKISGDNNVPHRKISFAALRPIETQSDSPMEYEGIGQIAHPNFVDPQFIRTKVILVSDDVLKVVWYALHHTSLFKRCQF